MLCDQSACAESSCNVYGAVCRVNRCKGCTAEWFYNGIKLTDKQCQGKLEKYYSYPIHKETYIKEPMCDMACNMDKCRDYNCYGERGVECVPDTCNDCEPMFYDKYGERITCSKLLR